MFFCNFYNQRSVIGFQLIYNWILFDLSKQIRWFVFNINTFSGGVVGENQF
jgi:hypothetical protein